MNLIGIKINVLQLILLFFLSCNLLAQENVMKDSPVKGIWIEKEKGVDTIYFRPQYDGEHPVFWLKREYRTIEDGHKLPGWYSGPYHYYLGNESISLFWFFSSSWWKPYFFEMLPGENVFRIENFFENPTEKESKGDTLTFVKLE